MAKVTPPKKVVKKKPEPKKHPLENVFGELVDQVALIADALKIKDAPDLPPVPFGEDPPINPPDPVPLPPPPPPPAPPLEPIPCCCDEEFCGFLKNAAKPLVKCKPTWDPSKPAGQRWEWTME